MTTNNHGPYQPLQQDDDSRAQIRLISLAPGDYDDPIIMTFSICVLELTPDEIAETKKLIKQDLYEFALESPDDIRESMRSFIGRIFASERAQRDYEALSYTWGTELSHEEVYVDGCAIKITQNLEIALRHVRSPLEERRMWIDALCINQSDIPERNSQVQLMGHIYGAAKRTIVWLGPAADASDMVMEGLEKISIGELSPLDFAQGMYQLASRSWWSRFWVIQEVVLAHEVIIHCGTRSLPFLTFISNFHKLMELESLRKFRCTESPQHILKVLETVDFNDLELFDRRELLPPSDPIEEQLVQIGTSLTKYWWNLSEIKTALGYTYARRRPMTPIGQLLIMYRFFKASDPRDRIYALLSLSSFRAHTIVPDYAKSIAAVFSEAMAVILMDTFRDGYTVWSLYFARDTSLGLPSWVPDFTYPYSVSMHGRNAVKRYGADASSISITYNHNLELVENVVGKLTKSKGALYPRYVDFSDNFQELHARGHVLGTVIACTELEDLQLGGEVSEDEVSEDEVSEDEVSEDEVSEDEVSEDEVSETEVLKDEKPASKDKWGYDMTDVITDTGRIGKSFMTHFITDTGRVGKALGRFGPGAVVAGLFGINFPFVLDRLEDGKYTMLSSAVLLSDHELSPPWRDRDQRFRKRKRVKTRLEHNFTII